MDQAPPVPFVGAIDANASIINCDTLLCADIDPTLSILYSQFGHCRREGKSILPAWDYCRTSPTVFSKGKEAQEVHVHEATFMMKVDLNVENPTLNVREVFFQPNTRRHINEAVDIKGYRLWRVSNCPRRHWRQHSCKPCKTTTKTKDTVRLRMKESAADDMSKRLAGSIQEALLSTRAKELVSLAGFVLRHLQCCHPCFRCFPGRTNASMRLSKACLVV